MTTQTGSLQYIISYTINFINADLVPFVFALAFAFFLFGVFRFYFVKGADPKERQQGQGFILGSVIAFAVMLSLWGLVNLARGTVPFLNNNQPGLPTFNSATNGSGSAPATSPNIPPQTSPNTPPATSPNAAPGRSTPSSDNSCANGQCKDVQGLF